MLKVNIKLKLTKQTLGFPLLWCLKYIYLFQTVSIRDFPGGPVVKNPPSNAGDTGLIPGQGTKIPHAKGQ